MTKDQHLEDQMQEAEEQQERNILRTAAIYVIIDRMSRTDAVKKARELELLQREAEENYEAIISGENGEIIEGYLDSDLNDPDEKNLNKYQIKAIYKELCEAEGISPE